MRMLKRLLAATALGLLAAGAAQAATLVYCSEGSPEGFDPAPWTSGTTFDASSRTVYNRLIEFKNGSTETEPGLAESWDISEDGTEITFHLRPGVKFQTTPYFTPTREMNADDVVFSFSASSTRQAPGTNMPPGSPGSISTPRMASSLKEIDKVDDMTVKFMLNKPDATVLATFPMDFASILSKEYADQLEAAGTKEQLNVAAGRHRPVHLRRLPAGRGDPLPGLPGLLGGKQPIDDLIFAITVDAACALQKLMAGECDVLPYPNPADLEALKANPDLQVMQQDGLNIGYLPTTPVAAVRQAGSAPRAEQGDRQGRDHRRGLPGCRRTPPMTRSRRPCGVQRPSSSDDPYDPAAAKKRLEAAGVTARDGALGDAGAAALQPELPAHGRADPGRLGQGRRDARSSPTNGASISRRPRRRTATARS